MSTVTCGFCNLTWGGTVLPAHECSGLSKASARTAEQEIRNDERLRCCKIVERFARAYVDRWIGTQGDKAKAEGWAILQAAADLRLPPSP